MPTHHEVTRLETFSDTVFGFALTLLVVSLEVPKEFGEFLVLIYGFAPFALTFTMVCWIWHEHNVFFRRYGLQDNWTVVLNCILLFLVLFYVYPLKFLSQLVLGQYAWLTPRAHITPLKNDEARQLMIVYSLGLVLIFTVFALLYVRAWRSRVALSLSALEQIQLRSGLRGHLLCALIGGLSIGIALADRTGHWLQYSGLVYVLNGPVLWWNGYLAGRAREALTKKVTA